ncbi:hypothetical protein [Pseudomonas fluorescens group sp. PF-69]
MTPRTQKRLKVHLEKWARWTAGLGVGLGGGSILARWMDSKGHLIFGGNSGPKKGPIDDWEAAIEACVLHLATTDLLAADVLRLEHDAGIDNVLSRRGIQGYDPINATSVRRAKALGISDRTYRRHLTTARQAVAAALKLETPLA